MPPSLASAETRTMFSPPRLALLPRPPREAPFQALTRRRRSAPSFDHARRSLSHSAEPSHSPLPPGSDLSDALSATLSFWRRNRGAAGPAGQHGWDGRTRGNGMAVQDGPQDEQVQNATGEGEGSVAMLYYRSLEEALAQGSTRKIWTRLGRFLSSSADDEELIGIIARMPTTAFSELLRCLDPFVVSGELDEASGIPISSAIAKTTHIGYLADEYGIRRIYIALLERLTTLTTLRTASGRNLQLSDFRILIRSAGAACDMYAAKRFWHGSRETGYRRWRQSDSYSEFVKARFLTEALYSQDDLARFRVRARNLHRSAYKYDKERLERLDVLRVNAMRSRTDRFGQNKASPLYAEHLTRILRKRQPVHRLLASAVTHGAATGEDIICAFMVAFGRTGSINPLKHLLWTTWRIRLTIDRETGESEVVGGALVRKDSPLYPTARLLEAVVHAFCCQGEVAAAYNLVDFIAQTYDVEIPRHVWSALLEWTYISSTTLVTAEWRLAGFPGKALKPDAVMFVWDTMRSEACGFEPGIREYDAVVRTLVRLRRFDEAAELMRGARAALYEPLVREQEEALFAAAQSVWQAVDGDAALARYRRAKARKAHAWSCLQGWCAEFLDQVRGRGPGRQHADERLARLVPDLVRDFWAFLPPVVRYRTAAGTVEFATDAVDLRSARRPLDVSMPAAGFRPPAGTSPYGAYPGRARLDLSMRAWLEKLPGYVSHGRRRRKLVRRPVRPVADAAVVGGPGGAVPLRWLAQQYT